MGRLLRYLSLFSGVGGFEKGIERAYNSNALEKEGKPKEGRNRSTTEQGIQFCNRLDTTLCTGGFTCIGYSEIDRFAKAVYKLHFPDLENFGDATQIEEKTLPDFELLVAGFPCQSFSIAGKRQGFLDTRGTLFFDIARILAYKQPKYFLLENVRGLLSHDNRRTFVTIIKVLADIGYSVEWQLLNTKDYGLPQNRERIFIAGCLRRLGRPEIFPITKNTGGDRLPQQETQGEGERISGSIDSNYWKGQGSRTFVEELTQHESQGCRVYSTDGLGVAIKSDAGGLGAKTGLYDVSPTIRAEHHNTKNVHFIEDEIRAVLTPDRQEKRQNGRRFKNNNEPAFTLTGQDIHGVSIGRRVRRLTPLECERLQGFPDGWTEYGIENGDTLIRVSDTQRYKCMGNAVSTNVIERIFSGWQKLNS